MPIHAIRRTLFASALAAVASTSMAQSGSNASPKDDNWLPIIQPGRMSRSHEAVPVRPIEKAPVPSVEAKATQPDRAPRPAIGTSPSQRQTETQTLPQPGRSIWTRSSQAAPATSSPRPTVTHATPPKPTEAPIELGENELGNTSPAVQARVLAAESLARGDNSTAEAILAGAVNRFPTDVRLAISLARVRETNENWQGAVAAYDAVLRLRPTESRWMLRRAECRYHAGQFKVAIEDYSAAEAAAAAFSPAEYARFGDAALRAGDPAMAEKAFTTLSKRQPEPVAQVEMLRAISALRQGHTNRARGILLQATARWPQDARLTDALRVVSTLDEKLAPTVSTAAATDATTGQEPIVETSATAAPSESAPAAKGWRASTKKPSTNAEAAPAELPTAGADEPQMLTPEMADLTTADAVTTAEVPAETAAKAPVEPETTDKPAPLGDEPAPLAIPDGEPRQLP